MELETDKKNEYIGETGIKIDDYNKARNKKAYEGVSVLCHAPFTSMDFSPDGSINVCNHYRRALVRYPYVRSFMDVWRGNDYKVLRKKMLEYDIDLFCRHCLIQIKSGCFSNAFSVEQYDTYPAESIEPEYPSVLSLRMSNKCNLACIQCEGQLSSRIAIEREGLKSAPRHTYSEQFYDEIESIINKIKYIEFLGGEPFLSSEHIRVLEIIKKNNAGCKLYANTNGMVLTDKIKSYIEELNFTSIAVSMDAVNATLHRKIRIGINHKRVVQNLKWLLALRKRKNIDITINVTELRQNWFHVPEVFLFAARNDCAVHVNHCVSPEKYSLYTLPLNCLKIVHKGLLKRRIQTGSILKKWDNYKRFDYLISLIEQAINNQINNKNYVIKQVEKGTFKGISFAGEMLWQMKLLLFRTEKIVERMGKKTLKFKKGLLEFKSKYTHNKFIRRINRAFILFFDIVIFLVMLFSKIVVNLSRKIYWKLVAVFM